MSEGLYAKAEKRTGVWIQTEDGKEIRIGEKTKIKKILFYGGAFRETPLAVFQRKAVQILTEKYCISQAKGGAAIYIGAEISFEESEKEAQGKAPAGGQDSPGLQSQDGSLATHGRAGLEAPAQDAGAPVNGADQLQGSRSV